MSELVSRIKTFMEDEARSCSMDFGCVTAEYVSRMWGGRFSIEEIEQGLTELRRREARNHGFADLGIHAVRNYGIMNPRNHGQWIKTTWGSGVMVNG